MSQSIDLGNVGAVNFNGASVDKINLNGTEVWSASFLITTGIWDGSFKITDKKYGYMLDHWSLATSSFQNYGSYAGPPMVGGVQVKGIYLHESMGHFVSVAFEGDRRNNIPFNSVTINGNVLIPSGSATGAARAYYDDSNLNPVPITVFTWIVDSITNPQPAYGTLTLTNNVSKTAGATTVVKFT